jgi:16S rRNA (uracil1498-N3)-methyltransferase
MTLPYFYEQSIRIPASSRFMLSEETSKHCIQVLRMKMGDLLHLTDGRGYLFTASIATADKKYCEVNIENSEFRNHNTRKISIGVSLLKNAGRFEWFLEKATEIGVYEIIPLLCQRTEKQHFRQDRMNNILIAAMLQSQQTWLPVLSVPTTFENVILQTEYQQRLIAHCEEDKRNVIRELKLESDIQILIGPEGDFSPAEIQAALNRNYLPVTLGETRLRTETAGVVAASLLMSL